MGVACGLPLLCMLPRSSWGRSSPGCSVAIHVVSSKKDAHWLKVPAALKIVAHILSVRFIRCALPSVPPFYLALVVEGPVGRHWVGAGLSSLALIFLSFYVSSGLVGTCCQLILPTQLCHVT